MDVAQNRSLGFAGKEILFRKIEFERYRKPHVVEYPRSAIVLNPQHTRQLKDYLHGHSHNDNNDKESGADQADTEERDGDNDSGSDDDDPRRLDKSTQLCSDAQLRSSLHLRWQHITPVGLGLVNLGNTCFANSVLQALAHVPALAQYFMTTFRSADNQLGAPFDFAFALAETFRKMHHAAQPPGRSGNGISGAYRPGQIMGNLRLLSKHFSLGRQSDAHEFAVQLLFACQKSLLHRLIGSKKVHPRVAHTTALYRMCGGYLLSQVTWSRQEEIQQLLRAGKQQEAMDLKMEAKQAQQQQQHEKRRTSRHGLDIQTLYSNTYDPFTILSVELAGHTLMHCLDKFCLVEELDGRCYHSPREVGVRAKKKLSIHVPPPVLIIHLKRFGPTGNKINKHVQFPLELNIIRYCTPLPSSLGRQQQQSSSASSHSLEKETREDCLYELNAVCVHEGSSINYGHYYTMAKASNDMWYEFNDSHVSRLSEEQLQRAQAYMLYYSRIPPNKRTMSAAKEHPSSGVRSEAPCTSMQHVNGQSSLLVSNHRTVYDKSLSVTSAEGGDDNAIGKEVSEAEVQALLEKRRCEAQQSSRNEPADAVQKKKTQTSSENASSDGEEGEENIHSGAPQRPANCAQNLKRVRDPPTDSDGDSEGDEQRDGTYVRRLRPQQGQRYSSFLHSSSNTTKANEDEEEGTDDDHGKDLPEEESRSTTEATTTKSSIYGGLIKSMKRISHGAKNNSNNAGVNTNFRVGRHAVSALHARKVHNTPDTVKRPATAPKFQQRIRDPMWEMEMDRGKLKKVKSTEKAPDPFKGTNPFQEVSHGMFDIRGRRRRD